MKRFDDEQIAAYLADELEASERDALEQALRDDAQLRERVEGLRATHGALADLLPSLDEAQQATADLSFPVAAPQRSGLRWMAYAAVIVVAFGSGFLTRGWMAPAVAPEPTPQVAFEDRLATTFATVSASRPGDSMMTRGLLTLAALRD